jgi:hypothetical protein
MNAITRRENFVSEVQAPIVAALRAGELTDESPIWAEVAERIATEGPKLGRTARCQEACGFFAEAHHGSWAWTVRQGSVWLAHAID